MPVTRAHPVLAHDIPKRGGGVRHMAILEPPDAAAWAAVGRVAALLDGRAAPPLPARPKGPGGPPSPWPGLAGALARARSRSRALAETAPLLVRADVAAFYPSVTPGALAGALVRGGADRDVATSAAAMVETWSSHGYRGLPIGPTASVPVARLVLRDTDRALGELGVRFLRWVDDYLVAVRDARQAALVLERFDEALAGAGLQRSAPKTRVLPAGALGAWPGGGYVLASTEVPTMER